MTNDPSDPQEEVIAFLSRGTTFGVSKVDVIETHASIVFLAGDLAYKLKKNLRYSYLDYSSVALRRAACEAEFAINGRLAPHLYRGVQPVTRENDRLALGGAGEPIDWLLIMRRFDQEMQFDRMAARGALPIELMRPLADRIAEVHAAAPRRPDHGGRDGLHKAIDITIENLKIAAAHGLPREDADRWSAMAVAALETLAPLLERRRVDGHVRACHGDLHLQNICLFEGVPTLFDAIEFDEAISCTDVLYDVAFLLMDLRYRGLDIHGNRIFNRYLDRVDEAAGLPALPLFLSTRAAIRAQIAVASALHRHDGAGDLKPFIDQARSYLDLALSFLAPAAPRLIAVGGVSGTGKTTVANAIAPSIQPVPGARVLRSDVLRKRAAGISPETRLSASAYSLEAHEENYRRLLDETRLCLSSGYSVIVDAVFAKAGERAALRDLAESVKVPFVGLWLDAPQAALERRIAGRHDDASDATVEVLHKQLGWVEKPTDWRRVDADGLSDAVVARVRAALAPDR
jgi:aminoglycoside phosphotransferase family enzyme/predicted kinase